MLLPEEGSRVAQNFARHSAAMGRIVGLPDATADKHYRTRTYALAARRSASGRRRNAGVPARNVVAAARNVRSTGRGCERKRGPPITIGQTLDRARQQSGARQPAEAEALLQQVHAQLPEQAEASHLLGVVAYLHEQHEAKADPTYPQANYQLGIALVRLGELEPRWRRSGALSRHALANRQHIIISA